MDEAIDVIEVNGMLFDVIETIDVINVNGTLVDVIEIIDMVFNGIDVDGMFFVIVKNGAAFNVILR